jgi:hypothetical protein
LGGDASPAFSNASSSTDDVADPSASSSSSSGSDAAAMTPVGGAGGRRAAPAALPLESLPVGDFEPLYRTVLDVQSGELPVLPLSIYGAGEGPGTAGDRAAGRPEPSCTCMTGR